MLNHAARTYLPVFHDQLRTSILGRATGRKMRNLQQRGAADEDDAKPSAATEEHIRKFFDAWRAGDHGGQSDALNKSVRLWRGDNAAGGVPVHAHLVLPNDFALDLARLVGPTPEVASSALEDVLRDLDPSAQTHVMQQTGAAVAECEPRHCFAGRR